MEEVSELLGDDMLLVEELVVVVEVVFEKDAEVEVVLRQVKSRCGSKCRGAGVE